MAFYRIFPKSKRTFAALLCPLPELLKERNWLKEIIVVKICRFVLWFNVIRAHITEDLRNDFRNHSVNGKVLICWQLLFLFFKEYHHCLKWVLKGFFPTILHYYTLYFPEMRYSCEWNTNVMRHFYISSERREHCIHAGFFFEFHVFFQVQYGCIYWGILCQSNVAFVSKECPTVLKCITRFNRTLQNSN